MVNGKQLTIVWHVDDLKLSHKDLMVIDEIIASLKAEYIKVGNMTIRREKSMTLWNDSGFFKTWQVLNQHGKISRRSAQGSA